LRTQHSANYVIFHITGEASIVKVEVEGQQGETTLTTRSEPHNRRAIHAEQEVNLARMRDVKSS